MNFRTLGPSFLLLFCSVLCFAGKDNPLRNPNSLIQPGDSSFQTTVLPLPHARVVVKDMALIKKDFPETQNMSSEEVDKWLIKHAGYIAETQAVKGAKIGANTEIGADSAHPLTAFRPQGYGRSMVLPVGDSGLLDIKGIGAVNPKLGHHSHGLASVGEGLREFAMEHLVQKIFDHEKSGDHTVGTYAVLDAGFDVNMASKGQASFHRPAGLIVRQAHVRSEEPHAFLETKDALRIEKILRSYGISSAVPKKSGSVINIQGSKDLAVIDFGSYFLNTAFGDRLVLCKEKLGQEKAKSASADQSNVGVIWDASHADYIHQAAFYKQIPDYFWGPSYRYDENGQLVFTGLDKPMDHLTMHAERFRGNMMNQNGIKDEIDMMLRHVQDHWDYCEAAYPTGEASFSSGASHGQPSAASGSSPKESNRSNKPRPATPSAPSLQDIESKEPAASQSAQ